MSNCISSVLQLSCARRYFQLLSGGKTVIALGDYNSPFRYDHLVDLDTLKPTSAMSGMASSSRLTLNDSAVHGEGYHSESEGLGSVRNQLGLDGHDEHRLGPTIDLSDLSGRNVFSEVRCSSIL